MSFNEAGVKVEKEGQLREESEEKWKWWRED